MQNKDNKPAVRRGDSALGFIALMLIIAVAAAVPFVFLTAYVSNMADVYADSYYAGLSVKLERIKSVDGKKVVVIGGSSVAFGYDSELFESETGLPLVNFGLYAGYGLKPMLDMSLKYICDGDIIVISPEYDTQMFSSYIGYDCLLKSAEHDSLVVKSLPLEYYPKLLSKLGDTVTAVRELAENPITEDGVYQLSSFNEYGDIAYDRPANVMDGGYSDDNLPTIKASLVTDEFAEMINEYVKAASRKGATVWFGFAPVNEQAVDAVLGTDVNAFVTALSEKLACRVIQTLPSHILDRAYFYDSNYHLNNAGAIYNTLLLVDDVKRELGSLTPDKTKYPEAPAFVDGTEVISSGVSGGVTYDITSSGAVITGLTEKGKALDTITVADIYGNTTVYKIASGAFAGSSATEITLPSTVRVIGGGLFADCPNLTLVKLNAETLPEVGDSLFDGANDEVKLAVPKSAYSNYVTNYFWSRYTKYLTKQ